MTATLNLLLLLMFFGFIIGPVLRVNKVIFKFYYKKDKKFEGKKDPIYEIKKKIANEVGINRYVIEKYELGWQHYRFSTWLYPIDIFEWKYILVGTIKIGSESVTIALNDYMKDQSITLGEYMESCLKIERDTLEAEKNAEKNIENILLNHNKEFNENFVK